MPTGLEAMNDAALNERLAAFERNPVDFINEVPPKFDAAGNPIAGHTVFSSAAIAEQSYIDARDAEREALLEQGPRIGTRAAISPNDLAANLVDTLRYTKLPEMETAKLTEAKLAETPWSDDYWGIYKGMLGARYADPNFPDAEDWKTNADYILANSAAEILKSRSATRINRLSPAEKYDALVGDSNGSLTQAMWAEGKRYYDSTGSVETWMGLCHGWAVAAYVLPRPKSSVTLLTPDNIPIKFYPADIKALATLLWANVPGRTRFIGGRCNDKEPATDSETGRVTSERCFDTNPGTWHLAIVNQIGIAKRSFVLDVTFDYEVWNQPVYGYQYTYFNPQTRKAAKTLNEAKVAIANFSSDKFKRFRSNQTRSVVGISMAVSYIVETVPRQREDDRPDYDAVQQVLYEYDLELDANDVIIGGEWYRNRHPDFLWTPAKGVEALTRFENNASGTWNNSRQALPIAWRNAAIQAAKEQRAPLAKIVQKLVEFAGGTAVSNPTNTDNGTRGSEGETGPTPVTPSPSPTPTPTPTPTPAPTPTPSRPANPINAFLNWLTGLFGRR